MTQIPINRVSGIRSRQSVSPARSAGVWVTAASRIHFGLMGFNQSNRPFGGVGMMIDQPATTVRVTRHDRLTIRGSDKRIPKLVANWAGYFQLQGPMDCTVEVLRQAPAHIGLGSGTQTALSVARALNVFFGIETNAPEHLAASVRRGKRSSVGSWGFHVGGCIAELGHHADRQLASDYRRANVPEEWRVLLAWPPQGGGLYGAAEESAFAGLQQVPHQTTARLESLALNSLLPSLRRADFDTFSDVLFEYGVLSGNCFASVQGGPFASAHVADTVQFIRSTGVAGVGQSSWGPLVFAVLPDEACGAWLRQKLQTSAAGRGLRSLVVRPSNQGALLEFEQA